MQDNLKRFERDLEDMYRNLQTTSSVIAGMMDLPFNEGIKVMVAVATKAAAISYLTYCIHTNKKFDIEGFVEVCRAQAEIALEMQPKIESWMAEIEATRATKQ